MASCEVFKRKNVKKKMILGSKNHNRLKMILAIKNQKQESRKHPRYNERQQGILHRHWHSALPLTIQIFGTGQHSYGVTCVLRHVGRIGAIAARIVDRDGIRDASGRWP